MSLILPTKKSSIAADLRAQLGANKVKDDGPSLRAYAVDASMYRLTPQVITLPESEADIDVVVDYAVQQSIPLTPRAAGTNLTGSAIGEGIILDISRMNRLLEVNREEQWARVQPGIVLNELNQQLHHTGLMFGPDPSSGDMCKLGGMLATNSSGPHTLRYGSVKDNALALRVRLEKGGWVDARSYEQDDPRLRDIFAQHPALRSAIDLISDHQELIRAKRPKVSKNSAGYNVFDVERGLAKGVVDLPKLFVGSEGTLGVFSEATIHLVVRPRSTATGLIHFKNLEEMGDAVHQLLALQPSALEVMDGNTLNLIGRSTYGIPDSSAATLLIEFDQDEDTGRGQRLLELCKTYRLASSPILASDPEQQAELWKARKALYPTLYRYDQKKKPINFVDDVVVSAERTGQLIRYLEEVFGRQDVQVAIFGHIGNGNAHIVPLLDVNDAQDFERMVEGYYDIHQVVLDRFEGSICGEHGDGRVRAEMVRRMFGDELYKLFESIKYELDRSGVFNPGVKISDVPFTEHIDFERLSKPCATCAKCNAVCPVYDVFQSEDMSSRGWFEIVTAPDYSYLNSKRVVEACLNCKSCRTVCPAGVDVSELILKRRAEEPNQMAGAIFNIQAHSSLFEPMLKLLARTQSIWDRPIPRKILEHVTRPILKKVAETARLPQELELPQLATSHLRDRYAHLVPQENSPQSNIAYFHGCAANYFDDGVGDAVINLLQREGLQPDLPRQRCSGTPIDTYGHRELAKEGARVNLKSLESYDTVVTGCASCTLALKDYAKWFEWEVEEGAANRLTQKVKHISEFMAERPPREGSRDETTSTSGPKQKVTYHSSCHLRAAGCTKAPRNLLASAPGIEYTEMQDADRCAGGAGTYVIKDYDTSQKIFERKRRAIEQSGAEVVATSCPACMIQLKNGSKGAYQVKHIAQVLNDAYDNTCTDGESSR